MDSLFYKVFHNKFLFYKIIKELKNLNSYENYKVVELFQRYSTAEQIIKNNIKKYQPSIEIYKNIKKDNQENFIFYQQLFTEHYQIYSSNSSELYKIIDNSNIVAFKSFVKVFNLNDNQVYESVKKFYTDGYILRSYPCMMLGQESPPKRERDITDYQGVKMLKYLLEVYHLSSTGFRLYYKIKNFIKLKLKSIIKLSNFIIKNRHLFENNQDNSLYYQNIRIKLKPININLITRNNLDFQIKQFSKEQLNSNFFGLLAKTTIPSSDKSLKNLLFSYYEISTFCIPPAEQRDLLRDVIEKSCKLKLNQFDIEEFLKVESTSLFKVFIYQHTEDMYWKSSCSGEPDQISLLEKHLNYIISSDEYLYPKLVGATIDLLKNGDQGTIEYLVQLKEKFSSFKIVLNQATNSDYVGLSITSKTILDFYFNNYKESNMFKEKSQIWKYVPIINSDFSTLEYYENQMKSLNKRFLVTNIEHNKEPNLKVDISTQDVIGEVEMDSILEKLLRAIKNPSVYQFDPDFDLSSYSNYLIKYFNSGDYEKKHLVFLLFKEISFKNNEPFNLSNVLQYSHPGLKNNFLNWIIDNYSVGNEKIISKKRKSSLGFDDENNIMEFISNFNISSNEEIQIRFKIGEDSFFNFLYTRGKYSEIFKLIIEGIMEINEPTQTGLYSWGSKFFKTFSNYKVEFLDLLINNLLYPKISNPKLLKTLQNWFNCFLSSAARNENIEFFDYINTCYTFNQIKSIFDKKEFLQINHFLLLYKSRVEIHDFVKKLADIK
ncbi:hypothetical protein DICPUDRAFT_99025 [Dictyostelium purpureum]|uniref:Uncharacterized protein n=1 Tax=Dictyostelium purpureum TaxID=5786 RepID=F0ZVM1_DICPU|nr:uncharacterized protein DICPUDRAFT_99025 [Dictyostelium purpureum]EGC32014.1 hypothetical protein DICPUDRAFT_99025 [Dictyostelium purpureum]|eukprot:XP_003291470.1 hypothetical protein DICPUDRAFT_99025 [Dictyostelium purpureum]